MANVVYGGRSYECGEDSVLDCLTAHGVVIPSSCRSGVCQTCLMRVTDGVVPERAQAGLKPTQAAQNYFLACSCFPQHDIAVEMSDAQAPQHTATVTDIRYLNADILGIKLKPAHTFDYRAGQFINVYKDENTARCYSLASVPSIDEELFLHVRKVPNGLMTGWLFEQLKTGDELTVSDAHGDCFYVPGNADQNILLIATGSGLAPLYGILQDALLNGHRGELCLYHGSNDSAGFYLVDELRKLEQQYDNFSYKPCISEGVATAQYAAGMVADVALDQHPDLSGWRVFLCGNPNMVNAAKHLTFFAGAAMRDIFADPFG